MLRDSLEFPRTLGLSDVVALERELLPHHVYQVLWKQTCGGARGADEA